MTQSTAGWHFDNTYTQLPTALFVRQIPTRVREPRLILLNVSLAEELGLDPAALMIEGANVFSGNTLPPGAEPLAQAYAGHQFGHFTMLGDGRAILLGEILDREGRRRDIQLKGSGQTPYSRRGDGLAAVGPVLREYIVSEAMQALGIPTTRSLAMTTTGEPVFRERLLPGAVLTRVAASHIRIGTFEYAAALGDQIILRTLADYVLSRHYPNTRQASQPYLALLMGVITRQAALVAAWMGVGFIHGVMNTDNMSITGETIDYGPCAFMDAYDAGTVFSSIDQTGRYAYANQPRIAQWNLARLAETLLPLLHSRVESAVSIAQECLTTYSETYRNCWLNTMRRKLGLLEPQNTDEALIAAWLQLLQQQKADFTNSHQALIALLDGDQQPIRTELFLTDESSSLAAFQAWRTRWQARLKEEKQPLSDVRNQMKNNNPVYIPRNHRVEAALTAAVENNDYEPARKLMNILAHPFDLQTDAADYRRPPRPEERVLQTFCGT